MHLDALISRLPDLLRTGWNRNPARIAPTEGPVGMGSTTALIEFTDGSRYVAKWVADRHARALDEGSAIAGRLAADGLMTGAPLPTVHDTLSLPTAEGAVALLRYVSGTPLTGSTAAEQRQIATMLARVHAAEVTTERAEFLPQVFAAVHDVEPWVRPAVESVWEEYSRLPPLTWGLLHTDPSPEAFLHDSSTGTTGLIDWTGATRGPILYDIASAIMYLGGSDNSRAFRASYLQAAPGLDAEIEAQLPTLHRFRSAVQAAYFAGRIHHSDATGIGSLEENWQGLHDGRRMLARHGVAILAS